MFKKSILENKNIIINSVCDLITYPSVSIKTDDPCLPFGKECDDCLKYFLNLAKSLGFRTKNIDGYCGWAEFGEGKELIGIIGHLDVVPAISDDWKHTPFTPTIEKNRIYGRGAIDDKGPVIASLFAMKAIMDYYKENNLTFNKRVRLIVGLNEEASWECINYYKKYEELPTIGFSPDADFPCIYAEKGVLSILISDILPEYKKNTFNLGLKNNVNPFSLIQIKNINCENNAINVVPKYCSVTLNFNEKLFIHDIIGFLKEKIDTYNYDIDIYKIDDYNLKLTSYGIASHSAHPEHGVNAITRLLVILNDLYAKFNISFPLLSTFCKYIGDNYLGTNLNINFKDESGGLTLNTSQAYINNNKLNIAINLRIPVNTKIDTIISIFENTFNKKNINVLSKLEPLYINKDNYLVKTLTSIFNETCNTSFEPLAIGGATYARAFKNIVSFGMNFPGDKDMCHQADEFIDIDKLILSTNIYAKAIYKLLN